MIRYRAAWVVPVSGPPLRDGWVDVDDGRIVGCGGHASPRRDQDVELGGVAILPGLVNAHTHLELSHLRGRVPPASNFIEWIRGVIAERARQPDPQALEIVAGVQEGISESLACGTVLVGDISNSLVSFVPLCASDLAAVVFHELIRFNTPDPDAVVADARNRLLALAATERVRPALAAHAPYSVSPHVFRAMRDSVRDDPSIRCSVHLSESIEEVEFIKSGTGAWRELLESMGSWDAAWVAPNVSPVEYLDAEGFLGPRVMAIHGVQMTSPDLARLAARDTTLVTCPRSNQYTGAGVPPIGRFYESGVRVAVGTDSLASAPDLNMFAELAAMRALAPTVPAAALLDSATRQGAIALGFGADYGTIEAGKRASMIAVNVPAGTGDVEEYLVGGIEPEDIRWLA